MTERAPVRRWLTEGAVIVGSILLAFAIDAWWQESQEATELDSVLAALEVEFEQNARRARETVEIHRARQIRVEELVAMTDSDIQGLDRAALAEAIRSIVAARSFDPETATLDALIGSGGLSRVRDPELRAQLTQFLRVLDDGSEEREWMQESAVEIFREMADRGGPFQLTPEPTTITIWPWAETSDVLGLLRDPEFMALVRYNIGTAQVYADEVDEAREVAERVLDLLHEGA